MTKEEEANAASIDVLRIDSTDTDRKPKSCCLCLNVRIGTIMIGLFNLVCHAFWIVSLSSYIKKHQSTELSEHLKEWKVINHFSDFAQQHQQNINHNMIAMVVACLSFLIVVMLVYGATLRLSGYILPFFCLQVFDLCLSVLVFATVTSYAPQLKYYLEVSAHDEVHRQYLQNMSLTHFRMILFSFWIVVLAVKYYFANTVWECYCHCKKMEERRNVRTDNQAAILLYQGDMETMNLLPTYDDVVKTSPPPAYIQ